jgi:hypothetical protein
MVPNGRSVVRTVRILLSRRSTASSYPAPAQVPLAPLGLRSRCLRAVAPACTGASAAPVVAGADRPPLMKSGTREIIGGRRPWTDPVSEGRPRLPSRRCGAGAAGVSDESAFHSPGSAGLRARAAALPTGATGPAPAGRRGSAVSRRAGARARAGTIAAGGRRLNRRESAQATPRSVACRFSGRTGTRRPGRRPARRAARR